MKLSKERNTANPFDLPKEKLYPDRHRQDSSLCRCLQRRLDNTRLCVAQGQLPFLPGEQPPPQNAKRG